MRPARAAEATLFPFGRTELGHGLERMVDRRHNRWHLRWRGREAYRRTSLMGGAPGGRPLWVRVCQPAGPQCQVAGLASGLRRVAPGVGGDLADRACDVEPVVAGAPGVVSGRGESGADLSEPAVLGAGGQGLKQECAVVAGDGAGPGDPAQGCHGHVRRPEGLFRRHPGQMTDPFGAGDRSLA